MERAIQCGMRALSNSELIALIIRTGTRDCSAPELARDLLRSFPDGLRGLGNASPKELVGHPGIGEAKAYALAAAVELGKRISSWNTEKIPISGAKDVADIFMEDLRYEKKEHFCALFLDAKGNVIHKDTIFTGELTGAPVHPREIFAPAIKVSAASIVVVHNHPSGDPTPSQEDINTTIRICDAGNLLGIKVLDHIVIGDGIYTSLRSLGKGVVS